MNIAKYIKPDGPGMTAYNILQELPDKECNIIDVVEALRWAERDGKITKQGIYYWRKK